MLIQASHPRHDFWHSYEAALYILLFAIGTHYLPVVHGFNILFYIFDPVHNVQRIPLSNLQRIALRPVSGFFAVIGLIFER